MRRHRTHEDFNLPIGIPKLLQLPGQGLHQSNGRTVQRDARQHPLCPKPLGRRLLQEGVGGAPVLMSQFSTLELRQLGGGDRLDVCLIALSPEHEAAGWVVEAALEQRFNPLRPLEMKCMLQNGEGLCVWGDPERRPRRGERPGQQLGTALELPKQTHRVPHRAQLQRMAHLRNRYEAAPTRRHQSQSRDRHPEPSRAIHGDPWRSRAIQGHPGPSDQGPSRAIGHSRALT